MASIAKTRLQVTQPGMIQMLEGARKRDTLTKLAGFLGQRMLLAPMGEFSDSSAGLPPDFSQLEAWIAHPQRAPASQAIEDANHISAASSTLPPMEDRPADCFYLVDSCFGFHDVAAFRGHAVAKQWNLPLGAACLEEQQVVAKSVELMQYRVAAGSSCFNKTCRIYAPKYRQMHIGAYIHLPALAKEAHDPKASIGPAKPKEMAQALDLAYDDVRRAFLHFVTDPRTADRPFVLAGHSQGTMHMVRLLQEEVEPHAERRARFVHAYLAGFSVPLDLFDRSLLSIKPSESATDICSVSSWRTTGQRHAISRILQSAAFYAGEGWLPTEDSQMLTNNPITWARGPEEHASDPAEFAGALWPLPANLADPRSEECGRLPSLRALSFGHRVGKGRGPLGAEVGVLMEIECGQVTAQVDGESVLRVPHFPKGTLFRLTEQDLLLYHDVDFALFHNNLQKNVALRVWGWVVANNRAPLRSPSMSE
eukprot:CAMPEP_0115195058 /NCGR_PEP_ID=MMETSP0270-20121206/14385_1 /TAXON_ID=71861 /ORGANISM="Scrippsiella trochoidea, Strain CCMP3099" /LENGTH=479 /DNA_ID=CAMNT_0002608369 /DNA_START=10 /DNA_END=1449 /DNA_ORIENTATION=-